VQLRTKKRLLSINLDSSIDDSLESDDFSRQRDKVVWQFSI
jgi:hypothetical protein